MNRSMPIPIPNRNKSMPIPVPNYMPIPVSSVVPVVPVVPVITTTTQPISRQEKVSKDI